MTDTHRVHFASQQPKPGHRVRARCGWWTTLFTSDPALVTCASCLRLLRQPPAPFNKTGPAIMKTLSTILLSLLILPACDGTDSTGSTGDSSSGTTGTMEASGTGDDATSGGEPSTTSAGTGSGSSTTDSVTSGISGSGDDSSTDDSSSDNNPTDGASTGEPGGCFGTPCATATDCDPGLFCATHLDQPGVSYCTVPCEKGSCAGVGEVAECGQPVAAECLPGAVAGIAIPVCFPL